MSDRMSMRYVREYEISTDAAPRRIDVLYGIEDLNPWLCRWYEFLWHPKWFWRWLTHPKPYGLKK